MKKFSFTVLAQSASEIAGKPVSFLLALFTMIGWALTGPIFNFSDTWQITVNTGTTIVTFLMVFLIQAEQNRSSIAVQAKLDELLKAVENARNTFVGIDRLTEAELRQIREKET